MTRHWPQLDKQTRIASLTDILSQPGASIADAAEKMGATYAAVYAYIRDYPELNALAERNNHRLSRNSKWHKMGVSERETAARKAYAEAGSLAGAAKSLGVSQRTLDLFFKNYPEARPYRPGQRLSPKIKEPAIQTDDLVKDFLPAFSPAPNSQPATFIECTGCVWPVGDDLFCNAPKQGPGKSYCAHHHAVSIDTNPDRKY